MTCPFCRVELIDIWLHGNQATRWRGCPCCGCMWHGRVDRVRQVHPLAWVPACLHRVPEWART